MCKKNINPEKIIYSSFFRPAAWTTLIQIIFVSSRSVFLRFQKLIGLQQQYPMNSRIDRRRKYGQTFQNHETQTKTLYKVVWGSNMEKKIEKYAYSLSSQFMKKNQDLWQEFPTDKVTSYSEMLFQNLAQANGRQTLYYLKDEVSTASILENVTEEAKNGSICSDRVDY